MILGREFERKGSRIHHDLQSAGLPAGRKATSIWSGPRSRTRIDARIVEHELGAYCGNAPTISSLINAIRWLPSLKIARLGGAPIRPTTSSMVFV
jgi:hypothetical protein